MSAGKKKKKRLVYSELTPSWINSCGEGACVTQWSTGPSVPYRAMQDGQAMVKSYGKTWSTGRGNGRLLQYSCLKNPIKSMKRGKKKKRKKKSMKGKKISSEVECVKHATGEEWKNSSRKKEEAGPKWKWSSFVYVSGGKSKVWFCKEQYW